MVKAKECCCGCTLRQGTLILLWIALIFDCIGIISSFSVLLSGKSIATGVIIYNLYSLMECIVSVTVSILGLYGIGKNMPQYLTGSYYYLWYYAIFFGVVALFLIIDPSLYYIISTQSKHYKKDEAITAVVVFLCFIPLMVYFAIIIKSLRDSMIEQKNSSGDTQIPADRSALGCGEA